MTLGQNGSELVVVPLLFLETCNFIWGAGKSIAWYK